MALLRILFLVLGFGLCFACESEQSRGLDALRELDPAILAALSLGKNAETTKQAAAAWRQALNQVDATHRCPGDIAAWGNAWAMEMDRYASIQKKRAKAAALHSRAADLAARQLHHMDDTGTGVPDPTLEKQYQEAARTADESSKLTRAEAQAASKSQSKLCQELSRLRDKYRWTPSVEATDAMESCIQH
jgi:hypothetical protein